MWCSVVTALDGDGRHRNVRQRSQLLFVGVIFLLTLLQPQTPAVITERDGNVVRIIEDLALALKVASLNFQSGEAWDQINQAKSCVFLA